MDVGWSARLVAALRPDGTDRRAIWREVAV